MAIGMGWSKWPPKDIRTSSNARPLGTASLSCTLVVLLSVVLVVVLLSLSSFALSSMLLSLFAMLKVNLRNKVGGEPHRACAVGGQGDGGAGRRCKGVAAPLHPRPGIVHTCRPDQDSISVGIPPSWLVNSPCQGAGHGAAGIVHCAKGQHCHLVRIVPTLSRRYTTFLEPPMDYLERYYSAASAAPHVLLLLGLTLQSLLATRLRSSLCPLPSGAFCCHKDKEEEEDGHYSGCTCGRIQQCIDCNANIITALATKKGKTTGKKKASKPVDFCTTRMWAKVIFSVWKRKRGRGRSPLSLLGGRVILHGISSSGKAVRLDIPPQQCQQLGWWGRQVLHLEKDAADNDMGRG
jgi:hypothetical protein